MKKLIYILTFALTLPLLGSCGDKVFNNLSDYTPSLESGEFEVSTRDFKFGAEESTKDGRINTELSWSFSDIPSWLTVTPSQGKSSSDFTVACNQNEFATSREAIFYVSPVNSTVNKGKIALTASQSAAKESISFNDYNENDKVTVNAKGGDLHIKINTNVDNLKVLLTPSEMGSASYDSESKIINVKIQPNYSNQSYNGTLIVSSTTNSSVSAKLTILQLGSNFSVGGGVEMKYNADGGSQTKTISCDLPWGAKTSDSWIDFNPKSGESGNTSITINVLPSYEKEDRVGYINFYYNPEEPCANMDIKITQEGRYIHVLPENILLAATENSTEIFSVDSNLSWEITSFPEWVSFNATKGEAGLTEVKVTVQKNNSLNSRSGTIIISDLHSGGIQAIVSVSQEGIDLGNDYKLEFGWHQSSKELELLFPSSWSAAISDGWISLSDYKGTGSNCIRVDVSKNEAEEPRSGKIIFTSESKTFEMDVIQEGQYIKIDNTAGEFGALGGTLLLTVSSTIQTSFKVDYMQSMKNWITVDKVSDGEYVLNVAYNPSSLERNASFILIPTDDDISEKYAQGIKLNIRQLGRNLSCDTSKITLFAKGGTSETYRIFHEGNYSIEKVSEDYWYTIVRDDEINGVFYIVATENTTGENRIGHIKMFLLDLPDGENLTKEIEVFQYKKGINLNFEQFADDENW